MKLLTRALCVGVVTLGALWSNTQAFAAPPATPPFVVQAAECEFSLHPIPIGRDDRGRIDRIELPGSTLRFVLGEEGNVVR